MTASGRVDLSRDVVVGDPVQKSALRWSVPYNVHDEAGNVADTVWRDVIVEEVNLTDIEKRIRNEILSQQKMEVDRIVAKGVNDERRRTENLLKQNGSDSIVPKCPECNSCPTSTNDGEQNCPVLDETSCYQFCAATTTTSTNQPCIFDEESMIVQVFRYFEEMNIFNPSILSAMLTCLAIIMTILVFRVFVSWILIAQSYNTRGLRYTEKEIQEEEERQRKLVESVTYYNSGVNGSVTSTSSDRRTSTSSSFLRNTSPMPVSNGSAAATANGFVPPPRASMTLGNDRSFLTPTGRTNGQSSTGMLQGPASAPPGHSLFGYSSQNRARIDLDDIYETPSSIITPSKRGNGISRT
jgi:hypothetical protein